jgi:hypothetical protein
MSIMSGFLSFPTSVFLAAHLILLSSILSSLLELLQRFVRACRAPGQPEKRALTPRHRAKATAGERRRKYKCKKHEKFENRT